MPLIKISIKVFGTFQYLSTRYKNYTGERIQEDFSISRLQDWESPRTNGPKKNLYLKNMGTKIVFLSV